ncbi:MAG TPA: RNA-binding S4 domain-containing protein [Planctomycetes bacterium]|nr:RNA-binding S4 domain-containing protein [Planctomycetota bacterium]
MTASIARPTTDVDVGWRSPSALKTFKLDQFLKYQGWVESGGEAKVLIRAGEVSVNGTVETRRGKRLEAGDVIQLGERSCVVGGA